MLKLIKEFPRVHGGARVGSSKNKANSALNDAEVRTERGKIYQSIRTDAPFNTFQLPLFHTFFLDVLIFSLINFYQNKNKNLSGMQIF